MHDVAGFSQDLMKITVFLILFCNESYAWKILVTIMQKIIPSNFYPNNLNNSGYTLSKKMIN